MIVAIDGTDWLYGERAIRRHVLNLIQLVGTFGEDFEYRIFINRFRKSPYPELPESRKNVEVLDFYCPQRIFEPLNLRLNLLSVDRILGEVDIFHAAGAKIFRCKARHYIYTAGGIAPFVCPQFLPPRYVEIMCGLINRARQWITHYIAVSEWTKREIVERFGVSPDRVTAIPLGIDPEFQPLDVEESRAYIAERHKISKPYALYVGGIDQRKNTQGLITAFSLLDRQLLENFQLVLVGPVSWPDPSIPEMIKKYGLQDHIVLAGHQSGESLVRFYSAANLFVFPTFYEGWTSPPLEAMACGVPVVASSASSVPETVGKAAVLADPGDPGAIAAAMQRVAGDTRLREDLIRKGLARAKKYTWERCIRATVDLYRRLLNS